MDVLKAITPDVPITTNTMPGMIDFDQYRLGRDLDFASWDSYPLGAVEMRGRLAAHGRATPDRATPTCRPFTTTSTAPPATGGSGSWSSSRGR